MEILALFFLLSEKVEAKFITHKYIEIAQEETQQEQEEGTPQEEETIQQEEETTQQEGETTQQETQQEETEQQEGGDIETIIQGYEEEPSLPYEFAEEEEKVQMFSLKGYYRVRVFLYSGLPQPQRNFTVRYIRPDFLQSRLRLEPAINISPSVRLMSQVDILDDVVWGEGLNGFSTSGETLCGTFNEGRNLTGCRGIPRVFAVKRVWGEIDSILTLPLKIKIGRQADDFGLGTHINDGNGFKNLWDDAHIGTTKDRILLNPKISDTFDFDIGIDFESSELADENLISYFFVPRLKFYNFSFQIYANAQRSEKTELYYFLPYISVSPTYNTMIQIEGGIFTGNVDYIPVFGDFSRYTVFAWDVAGRFKWETGLLRILFDAGFVSGDDNPGDKNLKSIPLHPDFNVGFILYEDVLARYTGKIASDIEENTGKNGEFFASKGGVFGSYYFMPTLGFFPFETIGAYLSTLVAFSNQLLMIDPSTGKQIFGREGKKGLLGVEINLGLKVGTENIEFGTQLGYLILGNALRSAIPQGAKNTFKTQFRFTWMF